MIQRIQTIYLFLSVVATGLLYFFPIWIPTEADLVPVKVSVLGFLTGLWVVMLGAQLVSIFLYNKRKRQLKLGSANIVLNLVFIITALIIVNAQKSLFSSIHDFKFGIVLPLISIILLIMANRAIRKDEELIRSMNRLR